MSSSYRSAASTRAESLIGRIPAAVAVPLLLALFVILSVTSMAHDGATFDEVPHLAAGYTYLVTRDFRMNPEHPPLLKELAALPLLFAHVKFDENWTEWHRGAEWQFGQRFLYDENDASRLIFLGRIPVVLIGSFLGLVLWLWTRDVAGRAAANVILFVYTLTPDFLAHTRLVTTDLAVTTFMFTSAYAAWRVVRCWNWIWVVYMALAFAAALATKFSSLVIIPVFIAYLTARVLFGSGWMYRPTQTSPTTRLESFGERLGAMVRAVGALVIVPMILIWACYGFRYAQPRNDSGSEIYNWADVVQGQSSLIGPILAARSAHLMPEPYLYGLLYTLRNAQTRVTFLNGEYSATGWWYYFVETFLLKTPVPLIVAIIAGLCLLPVRFSERSWTHVAIFLPTALYLAVTFSASLNIGHRHLLPVYPFLLVLAGDALKRSLRFRSAPYIVTAGLIWLAWGTFSVHPHYLAYFNELAGGPENGWRYLVDSNLDWGQDLPRLKEWMDREAIKKVHLSYFGTGVPEYYGINYSPLPSFPTLRLGEAAQVPIEAGDILAISATNLQKVHLGRDPRDPATPSFAALADYLRKQQPIAKLGYTIFLYRIPGVAAAAEAQ